MTAKNILRDGRRKGNRKIKRIGRRAVNAQFKQYPTVEKSGQKLIDWLDSGPFYMI